MITNETTGITATDEVDGATTKWARGATTNEATGTTTTDKSNRNNNI